MSQGKGMGLAHHEKAVLAVNYNSNAYMWLPISALKDRQEPYRSA